MSSKPIPPKSPRRGSAPDGTQWNTHPVDPPKHEAMHAASKAALEADHQAVKGEGRVPDAGARAARAGR